MENAPFPRATQFEPWLRRLPGFQAARVRRLSPAVGGASNITCRVDLEGAPLPAVCLRLQRERGIFEPYDVAREARVLTCLARSAVPVPQVLGVEARSETLGAPFVVLEWVDAPHLGEAGPEGDFGAFTRMVATVHALDWRSLGLAFLGVPPSPAAALRAELDVIAARMERWGLARDPVLAPALQALRGCVPGGGQVALCQGDINVYNYLFRAGQVVAVLDWEQARLSDPRSDVAHILALMLLRGAPFTPADATPFALAYGGASGAPLAGMAFFRARWLLELGAIYHGWRMFSGSEPWYGWEAVAEALPLALAELT